MKITVYMPRNTLPWYRNLWLRLKRQKALSANLIWSSYIQGYKQVELDFPMPIIVPNGARDRLCDGYTLVHGFNIYPIVSQVSNES